MAFRLPRAIDTAVESASSSESSEEFSEADLQLIRTELAKTLPTEDVKRISDVFAKFTKGTAEETQLEGIVSECAVSFGESF